MQSLKWFRSFDTGNAVIDNQHQGLVECLNEMMALMDEGKGKKVHTKCLEFRRLLDAHHADEESILRDAEYPRLNDHLVSHGETKERFNYVFTSCSEVCKDNRADPCLIDMNSILIRHLLQADMDFKSFLQTKGLANNNHGTN